MTQIENCFFFLILHPQTFELWALCVCLCTGGEEETKTGDTKENQTADAEPDETKDSGKEKKATGSEEKDKTDSKEKKKDKEDDKGGVKEKQVTVKEALNFTLTYLDIPDLTLDSLAKAKKK